MILAAIKYCSRQNGYYIGGKTVKSSIKILNLNIVFRLLSGLWHPKRFSVYLENEFFGAPISVPVNIQNHVGTLPFQQSSPMSPYFDPATQIRELHHK